MKEFTSLVLFFLLSTSLIFFVWLIIQCKSLFSGFISTCTAFIVFYSICKFISYIAVAIIWGVRFAAVIGILAFVLGIYPKKTENRNPLDTVS